MLRNLAITLLLVLAIAPLATADPAAEQTVLVDIDPSPRPTDGETRLYGYEQGWKYVNDDGQWTPVSQTEDLNENHRVLVAGPLSDMSQSEGYNYFLQMRYTPAVNEIRPDEEGLRSLYEQTRPAEPPRITTEDTNQENPSRQERNPDALPATNTGECGINRDYVKFCYYERSLYPYDPPRAQEAIRDFVQSTAVNKGYILVVHAPNDEQQNPQNERVRIGREQELKNLVEGVLQARTDGEPMKVVSGSYTTPAPGEDPNAAFLIPDAAATASTPTELVQRIKQRTPADPATVKNSLNGQDLEAQWRAQWENTVDEFQGNDQLKDLAQQVYERKGIATYLVSSETKWPIGDRKQLDAAIAARTAYALTNAPDTTHPRACAAYLLLDPQGIELYQPGYCALQIRRADLYGTNAQEHAVQMLRSALRHTPRIDAQRLMLSAYSLAEQGATFTDGRPEGEWLAQWAVTRADNAEFFRGEDLGEMRASRDVVLARQKLTFARGESALQDAIELAAAATPEAYPALRPLGAQTALQAALATGDCQLLSDLTQRVQQHLRRGTRAHTQAMQQLDECQYREVRDRCEPIDIGHAPRTVPALEILYIQDGLSDNEFDSLTESISRQIIEIDNLDNHAEDIGFRKAPSVGQIARSRGSRSAPRISSQLVQTTARACYGDAIIVLSDDDYLPVTAGGNGFVSYAACGGSDRCAAMYTLRSLGFGVFGMEQEEDTVTARLTFNEFTSDFEKRFSNPQKDLIDEYFGGGR